MGHCPYYQAIPERCALHERLRTDRRLAALVRQIFPLGSRPFDLDEGETCREDIEETLTRLAAEEPELFKSRADVEATLSELRGELERAEAASPGLVGRTAFLNKSQYEIEERLTRALEDRGVLDGAGHVKTLLTGAEEFAPGMNLDLFVVPAPLVREGAALLRDLDLAAIIDPSEDAYDWLEEDYPPWRELYLQASAQGEAILIY
jgi:hypothetical protein